MSVDIRNCAWPTSWLYEPWTLYGCGQKRARRRHRTLSGPLLELHKVMCSCDTHSELLPLHQRRRSVWVPGNEVDQVALPQSYRRRSTRSYYLACAVQEEGPDAWPRPAIVFVTNCPPRVLTHEAVRRAREVALASSRQP